MVDQDEVSRSLERLGAAIRSCPSAAECVMQRVRQMPLPIRRRVGPLQAALAAGLVTCLFAVLVAVWAVWRGGIGEPATPTKDASRHRQIAMSQAPAASGREQVQPENTGGQTLELQTQGESPPNQSVISWQSAQPRAENATVPRQATSTDLIGDHRQGAWPLSWRVALASAIVRAEMKSLADKDEVVYKVLQVLHGDAPKDKLRVRGGAEYFEVGRKVILFLTRHRPPDGTPGWLTQEILFDVPPRHSLDRREKQILEVLATGKFYLPRSIPGELGFYITASEKVVRAQLMKIGDTWAEAQVVAAPVFVAQRNHRGSNDRVPAKNPAKVEEKQPPASITFGLQPWRFRAQASVRLRAVAQSRHDITEAEVQEEFARLLEAELTLGREVILFLRAEGNLQRNKTYHLLGILLGDPDKPTHIDEIEKMMRDMIEKGEHWASRQRQ